MGDFPRQKMVLALICSAVLFAAAVLISGIFNPYMDLVGGEFTDMLTPQTQLVLGEAYSIIEILSAVEGMGDLPAFQAFPASQILVIFLMGSFLGMLFLWNILERRWFDVSGHSRLDECGMIWITHYFVNYAALYLISLVAYELTCFLNGIFCYLSRINGLFGILFLLVLAVPLILLYLICFLRPSGG